jgi:HSP20 family molecular chaperone IbpA
MFRPRVDVFKTDREYLLLANLPGVSTKSLQVAVQPPEVRIAGKRAVDGGRRVPYLRTLVLDEPIDPASVNTRYEHGLLRIRLAKRVAIRRSE